MAPRAFVTITTADALAPNWRQDISCANADLSSVEYVETKTINFFQIKQVLGLKNYLKVMVIFENSKSAGPQWVKRYIHVYLCVYVCVCVCACMCMLCAR